MDYELQGFFLDFFEPHSSGPVLVGSRSPVSPSPRRMFWRLALATRAALDIYRPKRMAVYNP